MSDYEDGYVKGPTPGGSGMADYTAGSLLRDLHDATRRAQEIANTPVIPVDAGAPPAPISNPWSTSPVGRGPAGPLQPWAPMPLSVGGLLVIVAIGAVLWLNTSVFLAAALIIGALGGAIVGTLLLFPLVRALSPGAHFSVGRIFQASFLAMCAYGTTMYVLTHFGAALLVPFDPYVQRWASSTPLLARLSVPAPMVSFLLLTQVPCLLVGGATLRWRLKGVFPTVTGYLVACTVILATLIVLGLGAGLFVREIFQRAAL